MKLVEFIFILYFDEDHKSFVIIFGSTLNQKGVILIER